MTIPQKRWFELSDALLRFRACPNEATNSELFSLEELTGWPWSASGEQRAEWQDIMNRTRVEFEGAINGQ